MMLVDMRVPCTTTQPTGRTHGNHKSHAMPARAQSDGHDDAQMMHDTPVLHMSITASVICMLEIHGVCVWRARTTQPHARASQKQRNRQKPRESAQQSVWLKAVAPLNDLAMFVTSDTSLEGALGL